MNQDQNTGGVRCHDAEACAMGQKPCPSPVACGCAPAQQAVPGVRLTGMGPDGGFLIAPAHPAEGVPATDGLLFQCGKAAGRQEVLDEQTGPDFWEWVRRAYRNPESTSFTVHNMAVAYRAGLAATQPAAQGMEKDAARYRWLVDCNRVPWLQFLDFAPGDDVDAAIDAAIAAEEEKRTQ